MQNAGKQEYNDTGIKRSFLYYCFLSHAFGMIPVKHSFFAFVL